MITINDIANRAGVAPSTVSRVLSGNGYAGKKTRDRVLRAADDLAYTPNGVAQSLRLNQTRTLGLVIADVENSFYSRIAKTVELVAKQAGFHVVLCNSNDDPQEEEVSVSSYWSDYESTDLDYSDGSRTLPTFGLCCRETQNRSTRP